MKRFLCVVTGILFSVLTVMPAMAAWPERPVTVLVGYAAGGNVDIIVRQMCDLLSKKLGQPFMVSNIPGADGGTMSMKLKNSPADGYTLGATMSGTYTCNPIFGAKYDVNTFEVLGGFAEFQEAWITQVDNANYSTFAEMVDWAKKSGKPINASIMSADSKLVLRAIAAEHGIRFNMIPAKGGAAIVTTIMGGHADIGYGGSAQTEYVKAGKVRMLAACTPGRLVAFPDQTNMREQGFPYDIHAVMLMVAPKGLPADVQEKIVAELKEASEAPAFSALVAGKLSLLQQYSTPQQMTEKLLSAYTMYSEIFKKVGLEAK